MKESHIKYYIQDTILLLKEEARSAKKRQDSTIGTSAHQFHIGNLSAFHHIISLLQMQATAFDIPLSELGLDDIQPDIELL